MDKTLLLRAIDDFEPYTKSQRSMLRILVGLSVEDVANVSCAYMMKNAGLSRPSIYLNLKKFENEGFITRIKNTGSKQDSYKLNLEELDYILQLYQNKKAMESD
jgi:Fe2+ or Zn2+ uptake regulation protein